MKGGRSGGCGGFLEENSRIKDGILLEAKEVVIDLRFGL